MEIAAGVPPVRESPPMIQMFHVTKSYPGDPYYHHSNGYNDVAPYYHKGGYYDHPHPLHAHDSNHHRGYGYGRIDAYGDLTRRMID